MLVFLQGKDSLIPLSLSSRLSLCVCLSVSTSAHPYLSANLLLFQDLLFSTDIQGFCLTTSVFWRNNFLVPAPKFPRKDFGGLSSPRFLSLRGRNGLDARMKIPWCMPVRLVTQLCLTLCDPMGGPCQTSHGDSLGKNTGVGCHALLQGIFPIQGSNPGLPHCRQILYCLSHQGSPRFPP